ncbi:MAG: hypothetical protein K2X74_06115, partial [Acetobacteraceae bacterium]|nr:hypothetical protein [Acetobacteraceae bacterium]
MNINIVRLDTLEDRRRAASGRYVRVESVPTMVVVYRDDTIQSYIGSDKIVGWMNNLMKSMQPQVSNTSSSSLSEEDEPRKSRKKKKKVSRRKPKV